MRKLAKKVKALAARFWLSERGSLDQLVWIIGAAVVVVLVVVILMNVAPSTTSSIWQSFVSYMRSSFGF